MKLDSRILVKGYHIHISLNHVSMTHANFLFVQMWIQLLRKKAECFLQQSRLRFCSRMIPIRYPFQSMPFSELRLFCVLRRDASHNTISCAWLHLVKRNTNTTQQKTPKQTTDSNMKSKNQEIVPARNSFTCLHDNKQTDKKCNDSIYCQTMKRVWYHMVTFHNIDCNIQNYVSSRYI